MCSSDLGTPMRANKNTSVCVATRPRPLIQIDANHTGQKPTGPFNRAARTSYVRLRRRTRRRNADGQRAGTPVRRQAELLQAWAIVPPATRGFRATAATAHFCWTKTETARLPRARPISIFGLEGWGFESLRARTPPSAPSSEPFPIP